MVAVAGVWLEHRRSRGFGHGGRSYEHWDEAHRLAHSKQQVRVKAGTEALASSSEAADRARLMAERRRRARGEEWRGEKHSGAHRARNGVVAGVNGAMAVANSPERQRRPRRFPVGVASVLGVPWLDSKRGSMERPPVQRLDKVGWREEEVGHGCARPRSPASLGLARKRRGRRGRVS